jgi:hypothetical protein
MVLRTLSRSRNETAPIQSFTELKQCSRINECARVATRIRISRALSASVYLGAIRNRENDSRFFKLHISAVI